jgi:hypothetical protein
VWLCLQNRSHMVSGNVFQPVRRYRASKSSNIKLRKG